jgi:uncharacterized delta-60 repeat protein
VNSSIVTYITVSRFNANGTLDTGFNGSGQIEFNVTADDAAQALAVEGDGKILVGGYRGLPNAAFLVARFNTDGTFDSTFGTNGITLTLPTMDNNNGQAMFIQPDGRVVLGGSTNAFSSGSQFAIVRYLGDSANLQATVLPLTLTENTPFNGVVATFTDSDGNTIPGPYTVTISWGDGATSTGTIAPGNAGGFTIAGTHTYARPGADTFSVSIQDSDGDSEQASLAEIVADAPLSATAVPLAGTTDGHSVGGVLANFTDGDPGAVAADYTATVTWGDGNSSVGAIGSGSGGFTVSATNSYAREGTYTVTIRIQDFGGSTAVVSSQIVVTDPALDAVFVPLSGTDTTPPAGVIAAFTDEDSNGTLRQYTTTISWGDGNTSAGVVASDGHGGFTVSGTNGYAAVGTYSATVAIFDQGGATTSVGGQITVIDPPLRTTFVPFSGTDGHQVGGMIADFTDSDPNGALGQYHSVITWGDGTTSAGALASDGHGAFTVSGTTSMSLSQMQGGRRRTLAAPSQSRIRRR